MDMLASRLSVSSNTGWWWHQSTVFMVSWWITYKIDVTSLTSSISLLIKASPCSNGACQSDEGGIDVSIKGWSVVTKVVMPWSRDVCCLYPLTLSLCSYVLNASKSYYRPILWRKACPKHDTYSIHITWTEQKHWTRVIYADNRQNSRPSTIADILTAFIFIWKMIYVLLNPTSLLWTSRSCYLVMDGVPLPLPSPRKHHPEMEMLIC